MDETNLLEKMVKFNNRSKARSKENKEKKEILTKVHMLLIRSTINY